MAKGVTLITKQRPNLLEDVNKLLLVWMKEKQLKGDSVCEGITCTKAKALHVYLVRKAPATSSQDEEAFKASRGWFHKFQKRTGIHSVVQHGQIKEVLIMWEIVQHFVEKHHPNKAVSGRCINLSNDNAMPHFRVILRQREKQVSLEELLLKLPKRQSSDPEPQPAPSGLTFPRRESPPQ